MNDNIRGFQSEIYAKHSFLLTNQSRKSPLLPKTNKYSFKKTALHTFLTRTSTQVYFQPHFKKKSREENASLPFWPCVSSLMSTLTLAPTERNSYVAWMLSKYDFSFTVAAAVAKYYLFPKVQGKHIWLGQKYFLLLERQTSHLPY